MNERLGPIFTAIMLFMTVAACPGLVERARADATDVAPLKEVLHSYLVAVETHDAAGLKACLFNIDPEVIDLQCAVLTNAREMEELGATKFAASPRPHPRQPKSVADLADQANKDYDEYSKLPVRITGDSAFMAVPGANGIKFKKIDGQWKIDGDAMFKDSSPENKRRDLLIYRITLKVREPLKQELAEGKFKDWVAVELALRGRLSKALAADAEYQQADKALTDSRNQRMAAARQQARPVPGRPAGGDAAAAPVVAAPGAADFARSAQVGGNGGEEFSQPSPSSGPVFGFRYSFGDWGDHKVFHTLDPLFELPAAGAAGADAADTKTVVGRAGYVVGGLIVAADEVSPVAIRVIFVRSKDGGIDTNDSYTSPWIGSPAGAHQQQLGRAHEKVIGTFGRKGLNVDAIGLLVVPASRPNTTRPAR